MFEYVKNKKDDLKNDPSLKKVTQNDNSSTYSYTNWITMSSLRDTDWLWWSSLWLGTSQWAAWLTTCLPAARWTWNMTTWTCTPTLQMETCAQSETEGSMKRCQWKTWSMGPIENIQWLTCHAHHVKKAISDTIRHSSILQIRIEKLCICW